MTFNGSNGKSYNTVEPPIGKGGEGTVYRISGIPDYVIKIYNNDKRTESRHRKIIAMINSPMPSDAMEQITWPKDIVYDNGQFVGYVMPVINNNEDLNVMYSDKYNCTLSEYITIAKNLCSAINSVHNAGQVCGDLNPKNISVDSKQGKVTLVDTDSYHITDPKDSKVYKCVMGLPEYLPKEIQMKMKNGMNLENAPLPTFTKYSDLFALAVHIFALLMNGCHPFACAVNNHINIGSLSNSQPSVVAPQPIENICNDFFPFVNKKNGITIPKYAPDFNVLPVDIQNLFIRAFVKGGKNPAERPDTIEWYNALTIMQSNLNTCTVNNNHMYAKHLTECPWCKVHEKMNPFFNNFGQLGIGTKLQQVAFSPQPQQFASSRSPLNTFNTQPITRKYSILTNTAIILLLTFFSLFSFHQYQTDNSDSPVGTYKLYSTTMDGNFSSKNLAKIHKKMGLSDGKDYYTGNLHLRQDRTGVMTFEGDSRTITWDSEKINVPGENEIYKYNLKDNKFTVFVTDDTTLVFEPQKNRIWLIIGILLVISCLIYINLNTLHKFRNALIVFMVIIIGFVVIKPKDSAKKQLPESQQTTLQTRNQSSTTNSNKKNKTADSKKTRKTTLEAEPGETFSVTKYVHSYKLNARSSQNVENDSNILFTIPQNDIVYISDTTKDKNKGWVKIKYKDDNHIGWVDGAFLREFVISNIQIGNHDDDSHWITRPGNTLYASRMEHLGIALDVNTINNYDKNIPLKIKIINPQNACIPNFHSDYSFIFTKRDMNVHCGIGTSFIPNYYYTGHLGTWRVEIWYQSSEDKGTDYCIATKFFDLN